MLAIGNCATFSSGSSLEVLVFLRLGDVLFLFLFLARADAGD
jgi:hypothetical protein